MKDDEFDLVVSLVCSFPKQNGSPISFSVDTLGRNIRKVRDIPRFTLSIGEALTQVEKGQLDFKHIVVIDKMQYKFLVTLAQKMIVELTED